MYSRTNEAEIQCYICTTVLIIVCIYKIIEIIISFFSNKKTSQSNASENLSENYPENYSENLETFNGVHSYYPNDDPQNVHLIIDNDFDSDSYYNQYY